MQLGPGVPRVHAYELGGLHKQRCWVWFRGGLSEGGHWKPGFVGTAAPEGGIRIEHPSFVSVRVPEWRVAVQEPGDLSQAPRGMPQSGPWLLGT